MPRGDGTGPMGLGPMTGRAAGFCAGFPVPGYMNPMGRRFWRRAFGVGRGWRHCYYATGLPFWARRFYPFNPVGAYLGGAESNVEDELALETKILSQEAKLLKEQLREIEERLEQLKRAKKEGLDKEKDQE